MTLRKVLEFLTLVFVTCIEVIMPASHCPFENEIIRIKCLVVLMFTGNY